jgi:hypothetical protein
VKIAGFLLLTAGWVIVIAALLLLHSPASMTGFVLAGIAVQILGLIFAIRSHREMDSERG